MIRIILDEYGEGHQDCWLKIDSVPILSSVFDSYFLSDFLELSIDVNDKSSFEITKIEIKALIEYWKSKIENCDRDQKIILAYDISDQYIGGLILKRNKLGFEISIGFCDKIFGYEITKSSLEKLIEEEKINFNSSTKEIILSKDSILEGLNKTLKSLE